jgi:hypothetical protein
MDAFITNAIKPVMLPGRQIGILDADLSFIYKTETKQMNRQVRRNTDWFDESLCYQMTKEEQLILRRQNGTAKDGRGGNTSLSLIYTEQGCIAVAFLLRSEPAIKMRKLVLDIFDRYRRNELYTPEQLPDDLRSIIADGVNYRLVKTVRRSRSLNWNKFNELCDLRQRGVSAKRTAAYIGVSVHTVNRFWKIALKFDRQYKQFTSTTNNLIPASLN